MELCPSHQVRSHKAPYSYKTSPLFNADIHNLWDNFRYGLLRATTDGPYLGSRANYQEPYQFTSYGDSLFIVKNIVEALKGRNYPTGENIGIFAKNRAEWILVDLACAAGNYVSVPLYDSFSNDDLRYIMLQTELKILFLTGDHLACIKEICSKEHSQPLELELLVVMDDVDNKFLEPYNEGKMNVLNMTAFSREGLSKRLLASPGEEMDDGQIPGGTAQKSDIATICYTSGTTGTPKGVVLSHGNILAELDALEIAGKAGKLFIPTKSDVHLSYLPLAHVFERVMVHYLTRMGGTVGFYLGNVQRLLDDMKALRPTIFVSVPRLLNRLYEKTKSTVEKKGGMSAYIFNRSIKRRERALLAGQIPKDGWCLDQLALNKLRNQLGGRVRAIVSGSAPLPTKVMNFLRTTFNAQVYEGYGQTETTAGITLTLMEETEPGHVGYPLPSFEIQIVPIEGFTQQEGEILVRGKAVFSGYYKSPDDTAQAFTDDGWYRTGDIGLWDNMGRLVIKDRVKSLFKLSQGEYVSPEKVENIYSECSDVVSGIFVTGNPLENFPVAIVVPELSAFSGDLDSKSKAKVIEEALLRIGKEKGLQGFEIPKRALLVDGFPGELLTPTFKLKRNATKRYYEKEILRLYDDERGQALVHLK